MSDSKCSSAFTVLAAIILAVGFAACGYLTTEGLKKL